MGGAAGAAACRAVSRPDAGGGTWRTAALERLGVELYARGLSTRDIEDALRAPQTGAGTRSRTAVSGITQTLWEEDATFHQRELAAFPVLAVFLDVFLDALYEARRRQGRTREGRLCAWGICEDGRKVALHLAVGNTQGYAGWRDATSCAIWSRTACPCRAPSRRMGYRASYARWTKLGPSVRGCGVGRIRCATSSPKCPKKRRPT